MARRIVAGSRRRRTALTPARGVPRARQKSSRAPWTLAAALAVALLAWLFWPAAKEPPTAPPPAVNARAKPEVAPPASRKAASRRPAAAPAAPPGVDEARLRAAVLARAADLRGCPVPAGAPSQVPVRLRVPASGEVRSIQLGGGDPLPSDLSACLRGKLLLWRFDDLHLASDVDLFATFALR